MEVANISNLTGRMPTKGFLNNIESATKGGLFIPQADYIAVSYPTSSTEVYVYKINGASGETVATLTLTYTDDTKANILSVAKT